jgi:hypothetical protein
LKKYGVSNVRRSCHNSRLSQQREFTGCSKYFRERGLAAVTGGTLGNSFADAERGSDERGVLHGAPAGNNAIGAATAGGIRDRHHGLGASEQNHQ